MDAGDSGLGGGTRISWTTELNDNDVRVGRGAVVSKGKGHTRFQNLIRSNKGEYTSATRHSVKNEIAARIRKTISDRGGRFVRKIETAATKEKVGAPLDLDVYLIVGEEAVMQKIKQALREQDPSVPKADRKQPPGQRKRKSDSTANLAAKSPAVEQTEVAFSKLGKNFVGVHTEHGTEAALGGDPDNRPEPAALRRRDLWQHESSPNLLGRETGAPRTSEVHDMRSARRSPRTEEQALDDRKPEARVKEPE